MNKLNGFGFRLLTTLGIVEDAPAAPAAPAEEVFEERSVDFLVDSKTNGIALAEELLRANTVLRNSTMSMLDEAKLVRYIDALKAFKPKEQLAVLVREASDKRMRFSFEVYNLAGDLLSTHVYFDEVQ